MSNASPGPPIDTAVSHSARVWNYWLGGKDNYEVDQIAGDKVRELYPDIVLLARAAREFLVRAVGFLPARKESASSWTSARACRPLTTRTTSPRLSPRSHGSCTWTTTR